MKEFKLQGYVSPEAFPGTPTEQLQKALDVSHELDIGRVQVTGSWTVDRPLRIHAMTELVLDHADLSVSGQFPLLVSSALDDESRASWSFEDKFIRLTGIDAIIRGELVFYHIHHLVLTGLELHQPAKFFFVREVRVTDCDLRGEIGLLIGRGSNNFIVQNLSGTCGKAAVLVDAAAQVGAYVWGKETEVHELILQDSTFRTETPAILLHATEDSQIFNLQIDHITNDGPILHIGDPAETLPETQYYNLTVVECASGASEQVIRNNPTRHCYFA